MKKIIVLILAIVLISISLSGCTNRSDPDIDITFTAKALYWWHRNNDKSDAVVTVYFDNGMSYEVFGCDLDKIQFNRLAKFSLYKNINIYGIERVDYLE